MRDARGVIGPCRKALQRAIYPSLSHTLKPRLRKCVNKAGMGPKFALWWKRRGSTGHGEQGSPIGRILVAFPTAKVLNSIDRTLTIEMEAQMSPPSAGQDQKRLGVTGIVHSKSRGAEVRSCMPKCGSRATVCFCVAMGAPERPFTLPACTDATPPPLVRPGFPPPAQVSVYAGAPTPASASGSALKAPLITPEECWLRAEDREDAEESSKALKALKRMYIALALCLALMVAEIVGGVIAHSISIISE